MEEIRIKGLTEKKLCIITYSTEIKCTKHKAALKENLYRKPDVPENTKPLCVQSSGPTHGMFSRG